MNGKITRTVEVELTPIDLATAFCEMGDEEQAQFFIECAVISRRWESPIARAMQFYEVGKHLRSCACSTEDARDMIRDIEIGMSGGVG